MTDQLPFLLPALFVGVLLVGALTRRTGRGMTRAGGAGIVAYALAEDVREVHRIFTRWGPAGKAAARASLRLDYLLAVLYAVLLFLAAWAVAGAAEQAGVAWLAVAGRFAAVGGAAAGLLDVLENSVLLRQLRTGPSSGAVRVARAAAQWKFALILVTVLVVFSTYGYVRLAG